MKLNKQYNNKVVNQFYTAFNRIIKSLKWSSLLLFVLGITACESFVEIDPPKNTLITETVFDDAATVKSAFANIYYKMREQGMVSGYFGLSIFMGSYSDELDYYGANTSALQVYNHTVTASSETISNWWGQAYNLIYAANDIIEGIENTEALDEDDQAQFKGQGLFVRAYLHSLLVALYGDIPYIKTASYLENNKVARMPAAAVYENIINDLTIAASLLDDTDTTGERVIPNQSAAHALLSRMYLYTEDWEKAEETAGKLISTHTLEADITKVFLKESAETIWQFKPGGASVENTQEGQALIITFVPTRGYALTNNLFNAFESGDLRHAHWIGSITSTDGLTTLHFAHKYKEAVNTTTLSLEYSIIFRLAEQYLIRAEARTHLGAIAGAQDDINAIRNRAGLSNTPATNKDDLLDAIIQERQVELFTEHGHRWFDLKRTGRASEVLQSVKTNWQDTQELLPIPDTELLVNPNLKPQNFGY